MNENKFNFKICYLGPTTGSSKKQFYFFDRFYNNSKGLTSLGFLKERLLNEIWSPDMNSWGVFLCSCLLLHNYLRWRYSPLPNLGNCLLFKVLIEEKLVATYITIKTNILNYPIPRFNRYYKLEKMSLTMARWCFIFDSIADSVEKEIFHGIRWTSKTSMYNLLRLLMATTILFRLKSIIIDHKSGSHGIIEQFSK